MRSPWPHCCQSGIYKSSTPLTKRHFPPTVAMGGPDPGRHERASFNKRNRTMFRKAHELATLCGANVYVFIDHPRATTVYNSVENAHWPLPDELLVISSTKCMVFWLTRRRRIGTPIFSGYTPPLWREVVVVGGHWNPLLAKCVECERLAWIAASRLPGLKWLENQESHANPDNEDSLPIQNQRQWLWRLFLVDWTASNIPSLDTPTSAIPWTYLSRAEYVFLNHKIHLQTTNRAIITWKIHMGLTIPGFLLRNF